MRGRMALRACMLGLVLMNLVFVQLTEATSLHWLVPLYALTLLAPVLSRLRDNLIYRGLWNAAVIAVFVVLLNHATGNNLRYVLEDGLVLAALCQVHLLNNLRSDQRPDLLFLNSFLIAIVTGFLSQDLAFAVVFFGYAICFIVGLQLHCMLDARAHDLSRRDTARVAWDGARRSGVLLALTLLAFLFWPRDFNRKSALSGELNFQSPLEKREVGFNDRVEFQQQTSSSASARVVMQIDLLRGRAGSVPGLWRGATLGASANGEWWPFPEANMTRQDGGDRTWGYARGQLVRGDASGAETVVDVRSLDPRAPRVFTPLSVRRLTVPSGRGEDQIVPQPDATLRYGDPNAALRAKLRYELLLATPNPEPSFATEAYTDGEPPRPGIARYTALPESRAVRRAQRLAEDLAGDVDSAAPQHVLVKHLRDQVAARHAYVLPGEPGAAEGFEDFISGGGGGHCELFASALATMLRTLGVPCRLVTGYRAHEWNAARTQLKVRARDAHAWVEVYDPLAGWYAVDPTPPSDLVFTPGVWERFQAAATDAWSQLTSFNEERRDAVLAWASTLPAALGSQARAHPVRSAATLAVLIACVLATRRRRRRGDPDVRAYQLALRRTKLALLPGETPRELLDRARHGTVEEPALVQLEAATRAHEERRYAA